MTSGFIEKIFKKIIELDASDSYITAGKPPVYRTINGFVNHDDQDLNRDDVAFLINRILDSKQYAEFNRKLEYNISLDWKNESRFRINFFYQQLSPGMVIRRIKTQIPTIESLKLPDIYAKLMDKKRGLIIISSASGTGKSTSVAAMLDHKNQNDYGHIVTVEDPIEYIHQNNKCIFTQREIGIDTSSYEDALKNVLRQRADVIFIGEIRDVQTMDYAISFAETGHLCISTLHSNNAVHAISRIANFYHEESQSKILHNLSNYLEAIISQRLINNVSGTKSLATEVVLNVGNIKNLIAEGRIKEIKEFIEKNNDLGMHSFDECLYDMYSKGIITEENAMNNSENAAAVKLKILQNTQIGNKKIITDKFILNEMKNNNSVF